MRVRSAIAVVALAAGLTPLAAPLAAAEDNVLDAGYGQIFYRDSDDMVILCDYAVDEVGVTGRLSIKQADGSWRHFPWMRDASADGACAFEVHDVVRENAAVYLAICKQNGPNGQRYACEYKWAPG